MDKLMNPRLTDNDKGEISVTLDGRELRGWSYASDAERRTKMLAAREYVEGWCDAAERSRPVTAGPVKTTTVEQMADEALAHCGDLDDFGRKMVSGPDFFRCGYESGFAAAQRAAPPAAAGREEIASTLARFFPGKQSLRDQAADAILALGSAVSPQEVWTSRDLAEAKAEAAAMHEYFHPGGWQPIETAPRDGTLIIAATNRGMTISCWSNGHFTGWMVGAEGPTHWRPLLDLPAASPLPRAEQGSGK